MTRLLVIGAAGRVGSATVREAVRNKIPTSAFLRDPTKLPEDIASLSSSFVTIIKGDATSPGAVQSAVSDGKEGSSGPVTAVVIAAPMGSMRERGATNYEKIAQNVITAVKQEQSRTSRRIKVWIMGGGAVLDHPDFRDRRLSTFMPVTFYEEYDHLLDWLSQNATDVDWTMNCPAKITSGTPAGPYFATVDIMPGYKRPFFLTRFLPFGRAVNIMYNWMTAPVTFDTLGRYMVDHLEVDTPLKAKRVGILEKPDAKSDKYV